jgi:hypothetical protein
MLNATSHRFVRRSIAVAVIAAVAGFAPSTADAKAKKQHPYTSDILSATLSTDHGYPAPGGTSVLGGTWVTKAFGSGALVDYVLITGQPSASTIAFDGTEVDFLARGTIRSMFTGRDEVLPDGSQKIATSGRFNGGTGIYRGAKGKFKFSGTAAPGSNVVHGHSAGTIVY